MSPGVLGPGVTVRCAASPSKEVTGRPARSKVTGTYCSEGPLTGQPSLNSGNGGTRPVRTGPTETCRCRLSVPSRSARTTVTGPAGAVVVAGAADTGAALDGSVVCSSGCAIASTKPQPAAVRTTASSAAAVRTVRFTRRRMPLRNGIAPQSPREGVTSGAGQVADHGGAEELDVRAHLLAGQLGVAVLHRLQHRPVQLGDRVQVGVALERADQAARLDAQRPPHVEQHVVARGLDDDLVEAGVGDHERVQVAVVGRPAHRGQLLAER